MPPVATQDPPGQAGGEDERQATAEEERLAAEAQAQAEAAQAAADQGEGFDGDGAGGEADTEPAIPQLTLPGTGKEIDCDVGGRLPDSSTLRMVGGAVAVPGQYHKGDVIEAIVKLRVVEAGAVDKMDEQTGAITETVRKHKARIIKLEVPE